MAIKFNNYKEYLRYIEWILNNKRINLLIVEGGNDSGFWRKFFKCEILGPKFKNGQNNKGAILSCIRHFQGLKKIDRLIGIIDSDFNIIRKRKQSLKHLFYTDNHDIDTQIFESPALYDYLNNYCRINGKPPTTQKCEKIREDSLRIVSEFGLYFLALQICNMQRISISDNICDYLDANLVLRRRDIASDLYRILNSNYLIFAREYGKNKRINHDRNQLADGHNLVRILCHSILTEPDFYKKGIQVKDLIENEKDPEERKEITNNFHQEIECGLRNSYDISYFHNSALYSDIHNATGTLFLK